MKEKNMPTTAYQVLKDTFDGLKQKYADAVFMFRHGDFYELFFSDAEKISEVIDLSCQLKKLSDETSFVKVPYLSFPHHALNIYLPKIIRAGHRVCICDPIDIPECEIVEQVIPGPKKNL